MSDVKRYLGIKESIDKAKTTMILTFDLIELEGIECVDQVKEAIRASITAIDGKLLIVEIPNEDFRKLKINRRKQFFKVVLSEDGPLTGMLYTSPIDNNPQEVKILKIENF